MKDMHGNELAIGDEVIVTGSFGKMNLELTKIEAFTPQKIRVYMGLKTPEQVSLYKKGGK